MLAARAGRPFSLAVLALLALAVSMLPATAARPNGAGVVIQFEDGSHIYAYVQFSEVSISSEQLLTRMGLDVVMAPYGGLGAGVCSIRGEGCPASNCWCRSYSHPDFYWHFYALKEGRWVEQLQGATSRVVRDGDVDGWLWTSGDTSLPSVTIEEIAAINGVDLSGDAPQSSTRGTPAAPPDTAAVAVFVPVEGTPEPLQITEADGGESMGTYALFAGMLAAGLATIAIVLARARVIGIADETTPHE